MILVNISLCVDKHNIRLKIPPKIQHVLQDFLADLRKAPGFKWSQDGVIPGHSQDLHALVMFRYKIGKGGIFLIVR